ncbi:MAG: rhomboid family intramembrane serine protease [Planctomycetota bacterium]
MLFPLYDRNPHHRFPVITVLLIAANVFFFWQSIQDGPRGFAETVYTRGFIPQRLTRLGEAEPVLVEEKIEDRRGQQFVVQRQLSTTTEEVYPTLLSMMFLHGGWLHLISNMWMLWVFGDNVEDRLGRFVYVFFYLVGGLLAVLTHWFIDPMSTQPVIGASGAVAAVLGDPGSLSR